MNREGEIDIAMYLLELSHWPSIYLGNGGGNTKHVLIFRGHGCCSCEYIRIN